MSKKILITGGYGMLATDMTAHYRQKGYDVYAPDIDELNILDTAQIHLAISGLKPDLIFHTAVYHVDPCEENPDIAYKLNTLAAGEIAKSAAKNDSILVFTSTCGLFGDEVKAYAEDDAVVLKTVYAQTKYEAEQLILAECPQSIIVRPGWLFGGSIKHARNFVYQRYLEAQGKPVLQSAGDKYGSPTYTGDLISKLDELIAERAYGLYHLANNGGTNRVGYVQKILEACRLDTRVEPVDSSNFPRKADVPNCEMLEDANLLKAGFKAMPSWEDAIERFAHTMLKEIEA
ncbi:SDR family oxidoreductase [Candidatus Margulisiibacteriota bacterium]